jgi:putative ABC transport system permease protein
MTYRPAASSNALRRLALSLRLAVKGLLRAPTTSVLGVAILALGLAAPTVFFSILVGAVRPLPVPDGERVVRVDVVQPARAGQPLPLESADLVGLGGPSSLDALGAFRASLVTVVDDGRAAVRLPLAELTPAVLPLLRVAPVQGRIPSADEAGEALLLGWEPWQEMYGGDPGALGRTVSVAGRPRTIVGVMPEGFGFPFQESAWTVFDPVAERGATERGAVELVGRLAEGVTHEAATAELDALWRRGDAMREAERTGAVVTVESFTGGRGEGGEIAAFVGLVLVALCLLLIACSNVANLLLVRASERVRTLGIQAALGAGRMQIGAQLMLESLLLALVGGAAGLALAHLAVRAIERSLAAEHFGYFWMRMAIDGTVVAFVAALVLVTAVVAGSVPAARVLRLDVRPVLQGAGSSGVAGGGRWGRIFVTVQLSLSCSALVAAALTARSMLIAQDFSGDVPAQEILLASVLLENDGQTRTTSEAIVEALSAIPGVEHVALALGAPGYQEPWNAVEVDVPADPAALAPQRTFWNAVTPGYFSAIGIEPRAGRLLDERDGAEAARVAVVNESFVRRYSPDRSALGRLVRVGARPDSAQWHTVVGVVADAPVGGGERMRHDRVYLPFAQAPSSSALVVLRARGDAVELAPTLRRAMTLVDASIPVSGVRTLADGHAYLTRVPKAMGALAFGGGVSGLLVAAVGLYGLLAFRVRRRRRELGVRLALGADRGRLARETLLFALGQIMPATVVGLALAWLAGPVLGVIVLGLDPRSPATLAAVGVTFVTVGLAATAVPTVHAASTHPAEALRSD